MEMIQIIYPNDLSPSIKGLPGRLRLLVLKELEGLVGAEEAPAPLALAFALGTALSFIPIPILDSLVLLLVLARFKHMSRPALLAARVVWNDLIVVPLYMPGFRLGMYLLHYLAPDSSLLAAKIAAFVIGCVVLAATAAVFSAIVMFGLLWAIICWRRLAGTRRRTG